MTLNSQEMTVCVVSGPTLSGKSYMLNWLRCLPAYKNAPLVEMDKIRQTIFGGRKLTDSEHVFKNEATLHALKTKLIMDRPSIIFMEMGLPTEEKHQKPLVATIVDAQRHINEEEIGRGRRCALRIALKIILNYCDIESVKRRIGYRRNHPGDDSGTDVFSLETWLRDMSLLFEPPRIYTPLPINTSDESEAAVQEYRQEVLSFISGDHLPIDSTAWRSRMNEFEDLINQARRISGQSHKRCFIPYKPDQRIDQFKKVKLLALDCDGVMTDGTTLVGTATFGSELQQMTGATGIELARFSHRDGAGIHALIETGVPVVMITSQTSEYVAIRGEKLKKVNGGDDRKFTYFHRVRNKVQCLLNYLVRYHPEITPSQVCYVGDDIGDIAVMKTVGLPVAVQDAQPEVKEVALYITERAGGDGAVREICDLIRQNQN